MKENTNNIDELLNGFIDEELTVREQTEVQRLLSHDEQVAKRLAELRRCRTLIASLAFDKAPAGMVEQIKTSLEKRMLLAQPGVSAEDFDYRRGARHLLMRKVLGAAALISLVAALAVTVYTIIAPDNSQQRPIAAQDWQRPLDVSRQVHLAKSRPEYEIRDMSFTGRVELKTATPTAVKAAINKAIGSNGLTGHVNFQVQDDKSIYNLSCSRDALGLLLADLQNIWTRFDSATLFVQTGRLGEQVQVTHVSAEQIAEIVNQDSLNNRVKVANDFALLNSMAERLPGREIFAALDDTRPELTGHWRVPKPVLTSPEAVRKPSPKADKQPQVHLTIVVTAGE